MLNGPSHHMFLAVRRQETSCFAVLLFLLSSSVSAFWASSEAVGIFVVSSKVFWG